MGYYCSICQKDITRGEFLDSENKYGRPLCKLHQELEENVPYEITFEEEEEEETAYK